MEIKLRIPLVLMVNGKYYNDEYGSDDSREDIIDDIQRRVLDVIDDYFAKFTFVTDSFIEED